MQLLKLRANAAKDSGNFYQTERSFDALQAAAENESGISGTFTRGWDLVWVGAGQQMANTVNQNTNPNIQNNQSNFNNLKKIVKTKKLFDSGLINEKEYQDKKTQLLSQLLNYLNFYGKSYKKTFYVFFFLY